MYFYFISAKRWEKQKLSPNIADKKTEIHEQVIQSSNSFSSANDCCETDNETVLFIHELSEGVKINCDLKKSRDREEDILTKERKEEDKTERKNPNFIIVRGSFHQADENKFPNFSNGRQCTANAAVAIVKCSIKDPELWVGNDVDNVLMVGDEIYRESIETRPHVSIREHNHMYLNAQEVKKKIAISTLTRYIHIEPVELGHLTKDMYDCMKLEDRLQEFLKSDGSAILTSNNISIAVGRNNNKIWMFDSYARDRFGRLNKDNTYEDNAACLTVFSNIYSLLEIIRHNIPYIRKKNKNLEFSNC